eukprot:COSAG02_NODE_71_length_42019_cov_36.443893_14_plen_153_part_00
MPNSVPSQLAGARSVRSQLRSGRHRMAMRRRLSRRRGCPPKGCQPKSCRRRSVLSVDPYRRRPPRQCRATCPGAGAPRLAMPDLTLEIGVRRVRSLGPGVPRLKTLSSLPSKKTPCTPVPVHVFVPQLDGAPAPPRAGVITHQLAAGFLQQR